MENLTLIKSEKVQNIINKFCYTIGMIPTSYKMSLTYEEQILAIGHYLETTVYPAINNNAEALAELQNLFLDLKNYVVNYFENLDVQNEINNKLDEMTKSGELEEIVLHALQIQGVLAFNTKNEMKTATNLIDGSICKTLGNNNYMDGQGAFYKIRTVTSSDDVDDNNIIALDISNTLIAEKIPYTDIYEIINNINLQINNINNDMPFISKNNNLTLQRNIIYDSPLNRHIQGMCNINGLLYLYQVIDNTKGDLIIFNPSSFTYEGKIQNLNFGHGNDLIYLDNINTIFSANNDNKKIGTYNLLNATQNTLQPFENIEELENYILWGITKIDENTLLCAFNNPNETPYHCKLSNDLYYSFNVSTNEIKKYTTLNPYNIDLNNLCDARQSFEFHNNKLFLLLNCNDCILECNIVNENINYNKIYNLPKYDMDNFPINEYEGLALLENGDFAISSVITNYYNGNYQYKIYKVNPVTNLTPQPMSKTITNHYSVEEDIYVNNSNTSVLYEDGTQNFPFKTILRGCLASNQKSKQSIVVFPGTYNETDRICDFYGRIYKKGDETGNVIINNDRFTRCFGEISNITFNRETNFINCDMRLDHCDYNNQIIADSASKLEAFYGKCNTESDIIPFVIKNQSLFIITSMQYVNTHSIRIKSVDDGIIFSGSYPESIDLSEAGYNFIRGKYSPNN